MGGVSLWAPARLKGAQRSDTSGKPQSHRMKQILTGLVRNFNVLIFTGHLQKGIRIFRLPELFDLKLSVFLPPLLTAHTTVLSRPQLATATSFLFSQVSQRIWLCNPAFKSVSENRGFESARRNCFTELWAKQNHLRDPVSSYLRAAFGRRACLGTSKPLGGNPPPTKGNHAEESHLCDTL